MKNTQKKTFMKFLVALLVFTLLAVTVVYSSNQGRPTTALAETGSAPRAPIPPIDDAAPSNIKTATFALG